MRVRINQAGQAGVLRQVDVVNPSGLSTRNGPNSAIDNRDGHVGQRRILQAIVNGTATRYFIVSDGIVIKSRLLHSFATMHVESGWGGMRMPTFWIVLVLLTGCAVDKTAEVDRLLAPYRAAGMPGASVMVINDGPAVLTMSYGLNDSRTNT